VRNTICVRLVLAELSHRTDLLREAKHALSVAERERASVADRLNSALRQAHLGEIESGSLENIHSGIARIESAIALPRCPHDDDEINELRAELAALRSRLARVLEYLSEHECGGHGLVHNCFRILTPETCGILRTGDLGPIEEEKP
jgi:hypothetical protein